MKDLPHVAFALLALIQQKGLRHAQIVAKDSIHLLVRIRVHLANLAHFQLLLQHTLLMYATVVPWERFHQQEVALVLIVAWARIQTRSGPLAFPLVSNVLLELMQMRLVLVHVPSVV